MAFFDKIKTLVGVEEDEFDDYLDEEPIQPTPRHTRSTGLGDTNMTIGRDQPLWKPPAPSPRPAPLYPDNTPHSYGRPAVRESVVDASPGSTIRALTQQFNIVVVVPKKYDDTKKLVDDLRARKPVIINLENIETAPARRIFEFLCGATYALSGNVQKIANNIFVFLPKNVNVTTSTERDTMGFGAPDGDSWPR
jgi:FtsZ-interacting cell division protein YlmF